MSNKTITQVFLVFALAMLFLSIYFLVPLFIIYSFCCVGMAYSCYRHEKDKT